MNTSWIDPCVAAVWRLVRENKGSLTWIGGGAASVALVLISCTAGSGVLMAPPSIPGATFAGSDSCDQCHEKVTRDFKTADHARLVSKGENAVNMGCESCHGPGSKHVESGGASGTIINPNKSPETCFQCHLDKKGEFSLPYSHPVLAGKMSCSDCHDPHKGSALKGGGTQIAATNETCFQCHTQQRGPFVFPHDAVRDGCSTCHNPHGSVNQKMLTERNATLCLKCHLQEQLTAPADNIVTIGDRAHNGFLPGGTCWTAGCHEAVHGSNVSNHLRN